MMVSAGSRERLFACLLLTLTIVVTCSGSDREESEYQSKIRNAFLLRQGILQGHRYDVTVNHNYRDVASVVSNMTSSVRRVLWSNSKGDDVQGQMAKGLFQNGKYDVSRGPYDVSQPCLNHTDLILEGLAQGQQWALRMLDAIGKPPSGLLRELNLIWVGSYEECVDSYAPVNLDTMTSPFKGQYCMPIILLDTKVNPLLGRIPSLAVGVCAPSTCSDADVKGLLNRGLLALNLTLPVLQANCKEEHMELDDKAIVIVIVLSIFVVVIVIGTLFDIIDVHGRTEKKVDKTDTTNDDVTSAQNRSIYKSMAGSQHVNNVIGESMESSSRMTAEEGLNKHSSAQPLLPTHENKSPKQPELGVIGKILVSFSAFTNGSKILSTAQPSGTLSAVNGIRFISMTWVILGHTLVFSLSYADNIATFYPEMMHRWTFQAISNATVSVDTFFVLSGLLLSYLSLKAMKKAGSAIRFPWGMYYFHRFWRLTPPYMLVLMAYVPLMKYWSNGPAWSQTGIEKDECRDTWWQNLLYINNFFKESDMCMAWSWYLANDMQFFVITPLLLVPFFYSKIMGGVVSLALILGSFIATGCISSGDSLPVGGGTNGFDLIYDKPWTRIGPYIVGIVTGYILYWTDCKVRIPKWANLLGWMVAAGMALSVLYGLYDPDNTHPLSLGMAALYNTTHRTAWAIAVSWVVFACATGYGGFVNTLLSWKALVPLSRLTYCAYLVHPIVMFTVVQSRLTLYHFTDISVTYMFLGNLALSYMVAFVVSLAFESPMMGLEKVFLKRGKQS